MLTKRCSRCKKYLPLDKFYPAKKGALKVSGYCKSCCNLYKKLKYPKTLLRAWDKAKRDHLKEEFIEAYGGKCSCCGESIPEFLTVDHINNDGEVHRKTISPKKKRGGNTSEVLRQLRKEGWPDYVRIL